MIRVIGNPKRPNFDKLRIYMTEIRDIIPPTERSIPPVRITNAWPNPTAKSIAVAFPTAFMLYTDKKFGFLIKKTITNMKSTSSEIYIAGSLWTYSMKPFAILLLFDSNTNTLLHQYFPVNS